MILFYLARFENFLKENQACILSHAIFNNIIKMDATHTCIVLHAQKYEQISFLFDKELFSGRLEC